MLETGYVLSSDLIQEIQPGNENQVCSKYIGSGNT